MTHTTKDSRPLRGKVVSFNLSPKGVPEGVLVRLLESPEIVQVNFDPEHAGSVTSATAEGHTVSIEARQGYDAHSEAIHKVFDLMKLTDESGSTFVAEGSAEIDVSVHGQVVRLNHARRGEVNGGILNTGDFVHLRPHGVKAIGGLSVGDTLQAHGEVRAGWSGHRVIEARSANGVEIGKPPHKAPHKPHGPKHGPEHGPKHKPLAKQH